MLRGLVALVLASRHAQSYVGPVALPRGRTSLSAAGGAGAGGAAAALPRGGMPSLSDDELARLAAEGRVERRSVAGRAGEAAVVVDSALAPEAVLAVLGDVPRWPSIMRGLRSARVRGVDGGSVRAAFKVTKLRLPANLVVTPGGTVVTFGLDAAAPNVAVERLAGAWRVEPRDGGGCRVALTASVEACRAVPRAAVDYVARKAMRRATEWLL